MNDVISKTAEAIRVGGNSEFDPTDRSLRRRDRALAQLDVSTLGAIPSVSLYERLQLTWLWPIYCRYFKRYKFISRFLSWLLTYVNKAAAYTRQEKRLRLVTLSALSSVNGATIVLRGGAVDTPAARFFSASNHELVMPHSSFSAPDVYVSRITDATVVGRTNFVFKADIAIHHDLYRFATDATSEELHGRHVIDFKRGFLRRASFEQPKSDNLFRAAVFLDACSSNYAHWMTEVLPRIASFVVDKRFAEVPILVDAGLHANIMESLALVCGDRRVILVPDGRAVTVDQLFVTSAAGYVPWGRRNSREVGHSHGIFNPNAISLAVSLVKAAIVNDERAWPTRIYLRRSSVGRALRNEAELMKILHSRGFSIVVPESLTFSDQVQLFENAEHIIGPTGAAFSNLIFSNNHAKIDIIVGRTSGTSYCYWQNIACTVGRRVRYISGSPVGADLGAHSDFTVDLECISAVLE